MCVARLVVPSVSCASLHAVACVLNTSSYDPRPETHPACVCARVCVCVCILAVCSCLDIDAMSTTVEKIVTSLNVTTENRVVKFLSDCKLP